MRYHTGVPIGSGGMGTVVKAFDPVLQRHVAIKILRRDDPELAERLLHEARAQAAVDHPNVAKVYEVGHLDDGLPFIAMQLIDGRPFDQAVAGLTLEQKVRLVATVAEAVHAAHTTGLIHRDLKPSNILVESSEEGLRPYVVDFGIAREEAMPGLTVTGQIVGTPGYMAPEQASGVVHQLDRRADVFSLGVILFEAVSGKQPFKGESAIEKLVSLLNDDPLSLRASLPTAPPDLDAIVAHCLDKDSSRRYASARALAEDLRAYLAGEPVQARRVTRIDRAVRLVRKHPAMSALLASAAALLLAAATVVAITSLGARRGAQLAHELGQRVERIDAVMRIARLLPLHDISSEKQQVRDEMAAIAGQVGNLDGQARPVTHFALGQGHLALQAWHEARRELEQAWNAGWRTQTCAVALARAHAELYRERLARVRRQRDEDARKAGLERAAADLRDPACRYLEAARGGNATEAVYVEGLLLLAERDPAAAIDRATALASDPRATAEAAAEAAKLAGEASLQQALELRWTADRERHMEALDLARVSFTRATTTLRSDPVALLGVCRTWAATVEMQTDAGQAPDEAMTAVEHACGLAVEADPARIEGPLTIGSAAIAVAQFAERRGLDPGPSLDRATALARNALSLEEASYDALLLEGTSLIIHADRLRNRPQQSIENLKEAAEIFARAQAIDGQRPEAFHAQGNVLITLATRQRGLGEDPTSSFKAAQTALRKALALPEGATRRTYNSLGLTHAELAYEAKLRGRDGAGELEKAIAVLEEAIALSPAYATAHNTLGMTYWTLAEQEAAAGRDAEPALQRAQRSFMRVLELDPSRAVGHTNMAGMLAFKARWQAGRGVDPTVTLELARSHNRAQEEAFPWDFRVTGADLELLAAEWARASSASPDHAIEVALGHAEAAVRLAPEEADSHRVLAAVARARTIRLVSDPRPDPARVNREAQAGLAHAARALAINPRAAQALACKAILLEVQSRVVGAQAPRERLREQARTAARAALAAEPTLDDPEVREVAR